MEKAGNDTEVISAAEVEQRLKQKIKELLAICAENEVDVPYELKKELLGDECASECSPSKHVLLAERESMRALEASEDHDLIKDFKARIAVLGGQLPAFDLRVENGSFSAMVPDKENDPLHKNRKEGEGGARRPNQDYATIQNSNMFYLTYASIMRCFRNEGQASIPKKEKVIMEGVNLVFEPSKLYLILGAPGSGKSTLLKMIAQKLAGKEATVGGKVTINGVDKDKGVFWENLVGYIDQIDRLHPWLTVFETCEFAWQCRNGGTHRKPWYATTEEANKMIEQMDENRSAVNNILNGFGLTRVKDTFVGGAKVVRGVSGGEKKRVTVAEMLCAGNPFICADEISTGLDAATTYDITKLMAQACRAKNMTMVVSLLQPPPETVANFDELILLSEGKVIYSGPVDDVLGHFESLGYELPDRMDVADWLQTLPTPEGAAFMKGAKETGSSKSELRKLHLTPKEFMEKFNESEKGQAIMQTLGTPYNEKEAGFIRTMATDKYANTKYQSFKLVLHRELLLWWRDKYKIKSKVGQNIILASVVGTIFFDASLSSTVGALFQSMFINILGAMLLVVKQFPDRSVFYKQQDANFFPAWTYVSSKSVANLPNACIDAFLYGIPVYWLFGLASPGEGATIGNFFMFLLLLLMISNSTALIFSVFPATMEVVTLAQAAMAVLVVFMILFSGFAIQPDVIPIWWKWAYWINPVAWGFRALIVNEFASGAYDEPSASDPNLTEGETILITFGFTDNNDEPFTFAWAGYAVLVLMGFSIVCLGLSALAFTHVRFATGKASAAAAEDVDDNEVVDDVNTASPIPFQRVDLTFKAIRYTVKSSISDEKLELLKGVDGVVESGKMTALMGSSGAGKTTLMDVLALRKTSGEIDGEVRLNGHLQEEVTFRRCMGYVEQFDTQTEQLSIREVVEFSARLRLDESDPAVTEESRKSFVDMTLAMLELARIQHMQVGSDETGGLSFEQRKRLSIAVELVSNPSVLFLDEPTSGLDARAALIVMRGLRRIAETGRAVCATIHQPSISIFSDFDRLLLLKRGGEVVFFGELGEGSSHLITYFERYESTPKIQPGENPATWMLTTIGAGSAASSGRAFDYAASYSESKLHHECLELIEKTNSIATEENNIKFATVYATSYWTQANEVYTRARVIYFRSPNYNITRMIVGCFVALLFGSAFINIRDLTSESDVNSVVNSVFVAVLFICVSSQNTILSFFEKERDMFYKHKSSGMYKASAIIKAFTLAEVPFILLSTAVFVIPFYFIMGFSHDADKFFLFYTFCLLGFSCFTFCGQMFVCLLRDAEIAQAVGGMWVTFSVLFSGVLIKPDQIPNFWIFAYWIFPGHYLFEALFLTQFWDDDTVVTANVGTPFFFSIPGCVDDNEATPCTGTVAQWMAATFPDYNRDHVYYCAIYLVLLLGVTRVATFWALTSLDYRSN